MAQQGSFIFSTRFYDQYWSEKFDFWKNVYGFDFTPLIPAYIQQLVEEPLITMIKQNQVRI